jgi:hypothetical protein
MDNENTETRNIVMVYTSIIFTLITLSAITDTNGIAITKATTTLLPFFVGFIDCRYFFMSSSIYQA